MAESVDIAMTAVLRPRVIKRVLQSIKTMICNSYDGQFRLILNIDPIGEDIHPQQIASIARSIFPNLIYRVAEKPSFPLAVKWIWSQVKSKYFLNVEDDFKVVKELDLNKMIHIMEDHQRMGSLRICRGKIELKRVKGKKRMQWSKPINDMNGEYITRGRCKWPYNERGFYLSPGGHGQFSMNPSLMRTEFVKQLIPYLEDGISPERILMVADWLPEAWGKKRYLRLKQYVFSWRVGMYAEPLVLEDLGRKWREQQKLVKPGKRGIGTTWERCDSTK